MQQSANHSATSAQLAPLDTSTSSWQSALVDGSGSGSSSTTGAMGEHNVDTSSNFVFVTKPLPSLESFLDWVTEQQLPNAHSVLNHSVTVRNRDEIVLLMDRSQFIEDTLGTFAPRERPQENKKREGVDAVNAESRAAASVSPAAGSRESGTSGSAQQRPPRRPFGSSYLEAKYRTFAAADLHTLVGLPDVEPLVPDTHWERLWEQFCRDLPRERFYIAGERISRVEEVFPRIHRFVADLPPYLKRQAILLTRPPRSGASAAGSPAAGAASTSSSPSTATTTPTTATTSTGNFFWGMLNFFARPLLPRTAVTPMMQSPASTPASPLASTPAAASQSAKEQERDELAATAEQVARLIALLAQQSVLALPFQILHNQYMSAAEASIYLGEPRAGERAEPSNVRGTRRTPLVERDIDPSDPLGPAMSVRLQLRGNGDACVVEIRKVFRVFTLLDDGEDTTLFLVAAKLTVNLFDTKDPVELVWSVRTPMRAAPRLCECLGATCGYHRAGCPQHPSNHVNNPASIAGGA